MTLRLAAALLALTTAQALAQSAFTGTSGGVARQNLGLEGGYVERIAVAADGTAYATLNSPNGLFCSTDHAATWTAPPQGSDFGNTSALAIGATPQTAYVVGGIHLYRTTDACRTFTELKLTGNDFSDFDMAMAYGHGTLLVAYRSGSIARSTDDGATLTLVPVTAPTNRFTDIVASPAAGTFYALAGTGSGATLYRSTDAGATWADAGSVACPDCRWLAVDPADGQHLFVAGNMRLLRSHDGGASWDDLAGSGAGGGAPSFGGTRLWVGNHFSDDDGASWTDLHQSATYTSELFGHAAQDPSEPSRVYMASLRGIARSDDGGATWTDAIHGLVGVRVRGIAQSADKQTVYLAATAGLARSTDFTAGPTWEYPLPAMTTDVYAVVLPDPSAPRTLVVAGVGAIYRSTDGGDSFTRSTVTSASLADHANVTDFAVGADGRLFAAFADRDTHRGGVLASDDGGTTWTDLALPNDAKANAVAVAGDAVLVGAGYEFDADPAGRGVFRWADGAWTHVSGAPVDGVLVADLAVVPPSTVYAAVGDEHLGAVLVSTDGGLTWSTAPGIPGDSWMRSLAVDPADTRIVYAASGRPAGKAVIFRTTDGGGTWSTFYEGLRDEVPYAMLVDGLMAGFDTGLFAFDAIGCRLRQDGRKHFVAELTVAGSAVGDLAARGIGNASASLVRLSKRGRPLGKARTAAIAANGGAGFRVAQKGSFRATCRWRGGDGTEVSADSDVVKKTKRP